MLVLFKETKIAKRSFILGYFINVFCFQLISDAFSYQLENQIFLFLVTIMIKYYNIGYLDIQFRTLLTELNGRIELFYYDQRSIGYILGWLLELGESILRQRVKRTIKEGSLQYIN
eukprot:TRINITY_DN54132_c0_g1_i4.p5 TRINITY_DN54132_c0_g1~~TRINITY_DN54132_c0_g1_i4.p5  ORF type:complete len:116 (-),score=1.96 TRINITY_DN54132_c0_g1_i4:273-620(-)